MSPASRAYWSGMSLNILQCPEQYPVTRKDPATKADGAKAENPQSGRWAPTARIQRPASSQEPCRHGETNQAVGPSVAWRWLANERMCRIAKDDMTSRRPGA